MDEITLLAAAAPEAAEFSAADRAAVRRDLLAAIAAEQATGRLPKAAVGRPLPRSWLATRRAGLAGGALAVLTAVAIAVLITLPGSKTTRPAVVRPAATGAGQAHPAPATARGLLLLAAQAAAVTPELRPGPRQFVYTEQLVVGEAYDNGSRLVKTPPTLQRTWISANGQWGGEAQARSLSGGRWAANGVPMPVCAVPDPSNANWQANCPAPPGYVTTLPSTVRGMLRYLNKTGGPNGPLPYRVLAGIASESWEARLLIPNRSYALMFRAAATVPGIRVIRHVTDVAGRAGFAVAACVPGAIQKGAMTGFHGCPQRIELVFDTRSYQFVGENEVGPVQAGSHSLALLRIAVVDRDGELP